MKKVLTIVDDFLSNPVLIRDTVIAHGFTTEKFEGVDYETVNVTYRPAEIFYHLEDLYHEKVKISVAAFRQGMEGSPLHNLVHADNSCSELASVLYLNEDAPFESGTAFWRHKATGWEHMPTEEQLSAKGYTTERFAADWHRAEAWEMVFLARAKFNRLITYPTTAFHSRWPWEGFGENDDEARLIHAAFFSLV